MSLWEKLRLRKSAPKFTKEQVLAARPIRNPQLEWEQGGEGEVLLKIRRRSDWKTKALSLFFPIPGDRTIVLDELGSFVWLMCDGETTMESIIRRFASHFKLNIKEAELSLMKFLSQDLARRGFVGFLVEKEASGQKEARLEQSKRRRKRKQQ